MVEDVSAALLVCDAMTDDEHWAMRFIRAFRILPPIHIKEQQSHIREQYSASTTYVFAWSEVYVQGLWALLIVALPTALALNERPWKLGWESWQFYLLQALVRRAKLCKMLAQTGAGNEFAEVVNLILS
eukprot:g27875.t1